MAELILIPCAGSKNPNDTHVIFPVGAPDIIANFAPNVQQDLINKRAALAPFANPVGGYSVAHFRYAGPHAWQYHFPQETWVVRAHPQVHVLIVSAYFGLLNPYSFIQDYDLIMTKSLIPMYDGAVMNFWSEDHFLHNLLVAYCNGENITDIHNLLPNNYQAAVELNIDILGVQIHNYAWQDNHGHNRGNWLSEHL